MKILLLSLFMNMSVPSMIHDCIMIHSKYVIKYIPVVISTYQPVEAQCDSEPFISADGTNIKNWQTVKYCALSRDMKRYYKFGDYIYIDDIYYKFVDIMNKRYTNCVDLCISNNFKKRYVLSLYIISKHYENRF